MVINPPQRHMAFTGSNTSHLLPPHKPKSCAALTQAMAEDLTAQQEALGAQAPPQGVSPEALQQVVDTSLRPYKAMVC